MMKITDQIKLEVNATKSAEYLTEAKQGADMLFELFLSMSSDDPMRAKLQAIHGLIGANVKVSLEMNQESETIIKTENKDLYK